MKIMARFYRYPYQVQELYRYQAVRSISGIDTFFSMLLASEKSIPAHRQRIPTDVPVKRKICAIIGYHPFFPRLWMSRMI